MNVQVDPHLLYIIKLYIEDCFLEGNVIYESAEQLINDLLIMFILNVLQCSPNILNTESEDK